MQIIKETIDDDIAYLIPIGDTHLGDALFTKRSEKKLKGYVGWVKDHSNARIFLNGDVFNTPTRVSKTSPFEINPYIVERQKTEAYFNERKWAEEILSPVSGQVIGATDGNHENRLIDYANEWPLLHLCEKLSTPEHKVIYCGISCLLFLKVGKGKNTKTFSIYLHHTTGGGGSPGGKINRAVKLKNIVAGCDVYCGNHNHLEGGVKTKIFLPDTKNFKVREVRQLPVCCGGFLDYGGYVERAMLEPSDIGAPKIIFDSIKKDVHLSM